MNAGIVRKITKCPHCEKAIYVYQEGNNEFFVIKPIEAEVVKDMKPARRQSTL